MGRDGEGVAAGFDIGVEEVAGIGGSGAAMFGLLFLRAGGMSGGDMTGR